MFFLEVPFLLAIPGFVLVYWLAGARVRPWLLLAATIGWLAWYSAPTLVALAGLTLGIVYPTATIAARARARGAEPVAVRAAWIGSIALVGISVVLRLKGYLFSGLGLSVSPEVNQLLQWLGFSYFLLKAVHVMGGTARGILERGSLFEHLQFALFLPTLTSGPIYRFDTFRTQLAARRPFAWDDVLIGSKRMVHGIAKKVVVVPVLMGAIDRLRGHYTIGSGVAYFVAYAMLFFDFSGYSDIAIGLGRLLGYEVPENFKNPFTSTTLTQFWRNWHATLGDWVRENVFIPMGGMRAKGLRIDAIVLGSMILVGLWHAYSVVFVLWGVYHGVLMIVENRLGIGPLRRHRTPKWRLWGRYAFVQLAVIGGMFAFVRTLDYVPPVALQAAKRAHAVTK